jgi:uncharacterized protein
MLVDANLLLFAVDRSSPFHRGASAWLSAQLNGPRRIGIPWQSLAAFLRISTHPRASVRPLTPDQAWALVAEWLDVGVVWTPEPGHRYAELLGEIVLRHEVRGNLVPDAQLAALALEHGLAVCSTDSDFALFTEVDWHNPLVAGG